MATAKKEKAPTPVEPQPIPEPVMRTMAPNTICANASARAEYERRLNNCMIAFESVDCSPCRSEKNAKNDGGNYGPYHLGSARRVRNGRGCIDVHVRRERRAQDRQFGHYAQSRRNPENNLAGWLSHGVLLKRPDFDPHLVGGIAAKATRAG